MPVRKRVLSTDHAQTDHERLPDMSTKLEAIDDANFDQEVLRSELPYLLEFSATWCSPCRALEPILEAVASELRGQLRVGKVDIDTAPEVAARYGVRGAPTVIVFRDGQESGRKLGLTQKRVLLELAGAARV
jgi:thioredoxin 1